MKMKDNFFYERKRYERLFSSFSWDSEKIIKKGYISLERVVESWDGQYILDLLDDMYQNVDIGRYDDLYKRFLAAKRLNTKFTHWKQYNRKYNEEFIITMVKYQNALGKHSYYFYMVEIAYLFASFLIVNKQIEQYKAFTLLAEMNDTLQDDFGKKLSTFFTFSYGLGFFKIREENE